ncbi:hypothetical protein Fuma_03611 [Fuerstiella marisgermanici]|uniref:Uncharacterized protein n=1 Tax=Fuerstiella marisgermanici TaxID=1891926 RepID=A0A1P8WIX2_9PLAN|nr:hypothetical protein Fuma_03611 [Fuerstiella marisgermanici]
MSGNVPVGIVMVNPLNGRNWTRGIFGVNTETP